MGRMQGLVVVFRKKCGFHNIIPHTVAGAGKEGKEDMEITGNEEKKSSMEEVDGLICAMTSAIHTQMNNSDNIALDPDLSYSVCALAELIRTRYTVREKHSSKITIKPDVITSSSSTSEITMTKDGITISDKPKQAKLQSMETGEAGIIEILRQETDMRTMKEHAAIALISEGKYDEATAILKSIDSKNIANEILSRFEFYWDKYGRQSAAKGGGEDGPCN